MGELSATMRLLLSSFNYMESVEARRERNKIIGLKRGWSDKRAEGGEGLLLLAEGGRNLKWVEEAIKNKNEPAHFL